MKSIILTLALFTSFTTFAKEECTPLHCEAISRAEIREIREQGIRERFAKHPAILAEIRKDYADRGLSRILPFEEFAEREFKYYAQAFEGSLQHSEREMQNLEEKYDVTFSDSTLLLDGRQILTARDVLSNKNTCLIAKEKGDRKKSCRTGRRSCAGQILLIFTLGAFGTRDCQEAYATCSYRRSWSAVVKTKINGQEAILPLWENIHSEYSEPRHHWIMLDVAKRARKPFKKEDEEVSKLLKRVPRCK